MSRRKIDSRSLRKRILILCEGITEVNYFKGIQTHEDFRRKFTALNVEIYQPKNYSPLGLAKEAIRKKKEAKKEKNAFDSIWTVFDRDHHKNVGKACNIVSQNKLNVCLSVICFEYWLLLHFEKTTKGFRDCDEIVNYIEKHNYLNPYSKSDNHFKILQDDTELAIKRSKEISNNLPPGKHPKDQDAFTNVHKLVEYLFKL